MPCKWMKVKQGVGEKSYSFKVDHYPCLISVNCDSFRPRRNMWKWSLGVKQMGGIRRVQTTDACRQHGENIRANRRPTKASSSTGSQGEQSIGDFSSNR